MTRNEFIAKTAARLFATPEFVTERTAIESASKLADSLEAANAAPWLTPPAPALTDAERRVVEAAVAWIEADPMRNICPDAFDLLVSAVRAYKESAK